MDENENNESSSSSDENEDNDMKTDLRRFKGYFDNDLMEEDKSVTTMDPVLQELFKKIEDLSNNDNDTHARIDQAILLCNELIDVIEKIPRISIAHFEQCWQILVKLLLNIESISSVKHEKPFVREIFFKLLDLLTKPKLCSFLNNDERIKQEQRLYYTQIIDILLQLASKTTSIAPFINNDINTCQYTDTFLAMYKRANYDLRGKFLADEAIIVERQTTNFILSFFWNLAYSTIIVPWLLNIGLIKGMLEWLKLTNLSEERVHIIVNIIHNISRHDDGADELKKSDALLIIKSFQVIRGNYFSKETNLILSMVIALLSTPEQIRQEKKRINKTLDQLLQITVEASKNTNDQCIRGSKFIHVSAPLAVFAKLFVDDHTLEYVLSHAKTKPPLDESSTITLFVDLLLKFRDAFKEEDHLRQFTCTAILNILWSISFHDRYLIELEKNENLLKTVKILALDNNKTIVEQYILRSMESMAKAAAGIRYNLDEDVDDNIDSGSSSDVNPKHPMVMISYAHANDRFCTKILTQLEKKEKIYDTWVDKKYLSSHGDMWEKIARAIKQSKVVICLLSEDYFNSKSCRKEALFAVKRMKPIIPVYIGNPGDCDWLDIHTAESKYIRFKNNAGELNHEKVEELLETIETTIKEIQNLPPQQITQHSIPTKSLKKTKLINTTNLDVQQPLVQWTADDIRKWFNDHQVPENLVILFNFQSLAEMQQYAVKLQTNSNTEFQKYGQLYAKRYPGEELEGYIFDRFKNALLSAINKQSGAMKNSTSSDQTSTPKSSVCTIL